MNLSKVEADSGYYKYDWRTVLELQNWSTLRTLTLCNEAITQTIVA